MRHLLIAVPLILTGCMTDRAARPAPLPPGASCDAALAQRLIGTRFEPPVAQNAMRVARARTVRVIRPGQAVTMDFRDDRLNVELGDDGAISALRCG